MSEVSCPICDHPLVVEFTLFHGRGLCYFCKAPYTVYHYAGEKLVSATPTCDIPEDLIPALRQAWKESCGDLSKFVPAARRITGYKDEGTQVQKVS